MIITLVCITISTLILIKVFLVLLMYVCLCLGVTDTQIEAAVDNGAHTMKQLTSELKIGSQCGKCCQCSKSILNNKLIQIAEAEPSVA